MRGLIGVPLVTLAFVLFVSCFSSISGSDSTTSLPPPPGIQYKSLAISRGSICALTSTGELSCWTPEITGLMKMPGEYRFISQNENGCACSIAADKTVQCWLAGAGPNAKVGDGRLLYKGRNRALNVKFMDMGIEACGIGPSKELQFEDLDMTSNFMNCGVTTQGRVYCWGEKASFDLQSPDGFIDVATTIYNVCVLTSKGQAACIGPNSPGHMSAPTTIFTEIHANNLGYVCGVTENKTLECWGYGEYDKNNHQDRDRATRENITLGDGSGLDKLVELLNVFDRIRQGETAKQFEKSLTYFRATSGSRNSVSVGSATIEGLLGIKAATAAYAESPDHYRDVINKNALNSPIAKQIAKASIGNHSSTACAILGDGTIECWGEGCGGKNRDRFGLCSPPAGRFKEIAVGFTAACAITMDDRVRCWGWDLPRHILEFP